MLLPQILHYKAQPRETTLGFSFSPLHQHPEYRTISRLRDRGIPLWVLEHQRRQKGISTLLACLRDSPEGNTLTGDMENRIELNCLDYETGLTHPSVAPYFGR